MKPETGVTLVCFALEEEAVPFRKTASSRDDLAILVTGIGRNNSARAVRKFFEAVIPERVITCGFAGGLNPNLKSGEVVFATANAQLAATLTEAGATPAKFACVDRIATTAQEKQTLRTRTLADAVEMESEAIQTLAAERNIPCATVRVISDSAQEDLPLDFNCLSNPDQSLNYGKLAIAVAKSPGKIPSLLKLQKQTSFAAKQLATKLALVLKIST